ncbi:acyltransferase [Hymenobacter sp. BT186]|uniref:Acyltransferase n=1 Tax=Hymenobacter telluris TaxID=2816474 RepID=A0A939JEV1_9BACT|nr:acyltransferase [Hymenobacter telluris]MBO0360820.1 acyltransferase [Hymenobacter telluris]MBW3376849.1 acyltransferase [Hymenobacter norwichensis]
MHLNVATTIQKRPINYNLEFLRGLAALIVVYHHVIEHSHLLDPGYAPKGVWSFNPPGHLSVLIFFILSGYVIGLTNPIPLRGKTILTYLKKRFWRIYPIYAVSVLFTGLISYPNHSGLELVQTLLFLQIADIGDTLAENNPLWSLDMEILFYMAFIPVSAFRINSRLLTIIAFVLPLTLIFLFTNVTVGLLIAHTTAFCFWLLGIVFSEKYMLVEPKKLNYSLLLSSVLAFASLNYFNAVLTLLNRVLAIFRPYSSLDESNWNANISLIKDFASLPLCAIVILLFVGASGKLVRYSYYALLALNLSTFYYLFQHWHEAQITSFAIPGLLFLFSIGLLLFQDNSVLNQKLESFMRWGAQLGSISYGIYVIHFPILYSFSLFPHFSGSAVSFAGRFILFMAFTLTAAFLLEKKWQPWIMNRFAATKPTSVSEAALKSV